MTAHHLTHFAFLLLTAFSSLASASTVAVTHTNPPTVCGIVAGQPTQYIQCFHYGQSTSIQPTNLSFESISGGLTFFCGLVSGGLSLLCWDIDDSGYYSTAFRPRRIYHSNTVALTDLTLGSSGQGIWEKNGLLTCWGRGVNRVQLNVTGNGGDSDSFESVFASSDFVCGLTTGNLTVTCWGIGWTDFDALCSGSGNICKSCPVHLPVAAPLPPILNIPPSTSPPPFEESGSAPPPAPPPPSGNPLPVAIVVLGSVGAFAGLCSIAFFVAGIVRQRNRNSVQPSSAAAAATTAAGIPAVPLSWRQRSGSSSKYTEYRTENFSLSELAVATDDFSPDNKIGTGSFGVVYKGKLADGREVAIKRGEATTRIKKLKEKESAFDSELALLSRLHHKHLVGLIGFCEEFNEHLLIYEYMANGALYDHLHRQKGQNDAVSTAGIILNSWKMRIKIALDASRGIEYLHNYAVPPIIHRDIKSSNILLDANWTARVSDFGLSLMGPENDGGQHFMSTKAVGTVGYIDPEYYVSNVLTTKSDIYGLGVVLLELLTGKRAVFRNGEEDGGGPIGIVEYAAPLILAGELEAVLDKRVGLPRSYEAEAVAIMAGLAAECVNLEGVERPDVVDVVGNLERAFGLCQEFQATFSSGSLSD
uniref:Protein kinase domain-containing protein n=1 Tax=Linum usitatissimum TaxID=4006 RepID=I6XCS3_LINUS|nr:hypothetical protein [Linum usitatissimum]